MALTRKTNAVAQCRSAGIKVVDIYFDTGNLLLLVIQQINVWYAFRWLMTIALVKLWSTSPAGLTSAASSRPGAHTLENRSIDLEFTPTADSTLPWRILRSGPTTCCPPDSLEQWCWPPLEASWTMRRKDSWVLLLRLKPMFSLKLRREQPSHWALVSGWVTTTFGTPGPVSLELVLVSARLAAMAMVSSGNEIVHVLTNDVSQP